MTAPAPTDADSETDPRRPLAELYRSRRTGPGGLSGSEVLRSRTVHGTNDITRVGGRRWPSQLGAQLTQPLVVLLAVAAVLAWVGGTPALSFAVLAVILLNAGFAFVQERQAEQAVDALAAFVPVTARVVRDGIRQEVPAADLVPGDVVVVAEGDPVCADDRVVDGTVLVDLSAPAPRAPGARPPPW